MERIDGKRLRAIRNYRKMSLSDLAKESGVCYQTITDIEVGSAKSPQFMTLSKICYALRCKVDNIIINEKE